DHNHCIGVPTIIIDEVSELVSNLYQYDNSDCLMTDGNTWGDRRTIPTQPSTQSSHNTLSWTACYDDACMVHRGDKEA
ncbi:hypothetical protein L873DRAFT_1802022, partial [Choiromyces venosus 120613-1]